MNRVRIGLIGVRGRGGLGDLWHQLYRDRAEVVAGMDVSEAALELFRRDVHPQAFLTRDVDEMLARPDVDAVAITSPDHTHETYALKAFAAGKHVFCEKPMAITTEGCDRMLDAWRKAGTHFMIGFNMRYMNIFRVMKDVVDSGTIGELKVIWCRHFVGHGGRWYFHDWHGSRRHTTSLLLQKAAHDIDMMHWISGRYTKRVSGFGSLAYYGGDKPDDLRCPACPEKDTCVEFLDEASREWNRFNQCVFRREVDVEDNSTILMELDGGIHATYMQCHFTPDYCRNYTFIGTEGRVENLDDTSEVIVKLRTQSRRWSNLADRRYTIKPALGGHGGADPVICADFLDMLQNGVRPTATPLAGRMSVAAAVAGTESIRGGGGIREVPDLPADLKDFVF